MGRGDVLAGVRKFYDVLKIGEDEIQATYYMQQTNMQGQVVGGMNAFIKKVGGAIIGIDNSLRSMAEKGEVINQNKELRKMIEEYINLDKISR